AWVPTWAKVTHPLAAFHQRMGSKPAAPRPPITQNPGRVNSPRRAGDANRNRNAETPQRTMVYFAMTPSAIISPAAGQAHLRPRTIAAWPQTSDNPQQQVNGESMVISTPAT